MALAIIASGLFATAHFNTPSGAVQGQHANAVAAESSTPNASGTSQAENRPAKTANPQSKKGNTRSEDKTSTSTQSGSGGSSSSQAGASAELIIKSTSLDDPAMVCDGQQPAYAVQTARITTSTSIHGGGSIRWYWETRVDSAESTDTPPISPQVYTQSVSAGSMPLVFKNANESEPLIKAPTSRNYSYSFRLHILGPNEVVSDWISVPVVLDNSCAIQN